MTTTASDPQIVPRQPAAAPALRAADPGVADALEAVLSDNTQRVYGAQWRLFIDWCDEVGVTPLPAEPLTVARYLAARAGDGASIAPCAWPRPPSPRSMSGQVTIRPAGTRACTPVKRIWKTSDLQNSQIADWPANWPAAGGNLQKSRQNAADVPVARDRAPGYNQSEAGRLRCKQKRPTPIARPRGRMARHRSLQGRVRRFESGRGL